MVGRGRLPVPTFRTDDWPIPEGVNYSKEAQAAASEILGRLKTEAERQALDRKIRQMQIDIPGLEQTLYVQKDKSLRKLVNSKISRMELILDELQKDEWLSRNIGQYPELAEKIEAARKTIEAAKAQADKVDLENFSTTILILSVFTPSIFRTWRRAAFAATSATVFHEPPTQASAAKSVAEFRSSKVTCRVLIFAALSSWNWIQCGPLIFASGAQALRFPPTIRFQPLTAFSGPKPPAELEAVSFADKARSFLSVFLTPIR